MFAAISDRRFRFDPENMYPRIKSGLVVAVLILICPIEIHALPWQLNIAAVQVQY